VTAKAYCSNCGAALRPDDRFCARCGGTANAGTPTDVHPQEFHPKDGPVQRIGDFAVDHAKGLLALLAIATLAGIGFLFGQEKSVPESTSSPGYEMVRELKSSGAIDSFTAIEPEDGWETEYSLNDGDGNIRFRGSEMEYGVRSYDDDLRDAIESEAHREGFTG
jgi:zinc ribbon protein